MNRKLTLVVIALIVVSLTLGGLFYVESHSNTIANDFGFSEQISSNGIFSSALVNPAVSVNSSLSFKQLAENPSLINPTNMSNAGWSAWQITNTSITVYSDEANMSTIATPNVVPFVDIQNSLATNVTLYLSVNLTNGKIASFALANNSTIAAGYILAVTNGSNTTLVSSANSTAGTVVGRGQLITQNITVTLQPKENFDLFLSTIPYSGITNTISVNGLGTSGYVTVAV